MCMCYFQHCENTWCFLSSVPSLSQCCDLGYHSSLSRALRTYLSAELSLEASRRAGLEVLEGAVEGLDPARDRQRLLGLYPTAFCPPQRFSFQSHMGDAVSISHQTHPGVQFQFRCIFFRCRIYNSSQTFSQILRLFCLTKVSEYMHNCDLQNVIFYWHYESPLYTPLDISFWFWV